MLIPTTEEQAAQHLTNLEASLGQTVPLQSKAFLRVLAAMEAMGGTALYKLAIERAKQNFAMTACGEDLDRIGEHYGVYRKLAEFAQVTATIEATNGVTVPLTAAFVGDANGVRFSMDTSVLAADDAAVLTLSAEVEGAVANLQVDDTLTIVSQEAGVGSTAVVLAVLNTGTEEETDASYRPRILAVMREVRGGGNAAQYKSWAEEVAGVARAFPYSGKPAGGGISYPGDRTVYIQATTDVNPDGIPGGGLLTEVRAALNYDPATGQTRQPLGLIDSALYVEAISRSIVDITVTNLVAPGGTEVDVRAAIETAMGLYLSQLAPYILGVDLPQDQNDKITAPAFAAILQEVLVTTGSSADGIAFEVDTVPRTSYNLSQGELLKLGTVTYATV